LFAGFLNEIFSVGQVLGNWDGLELFASMQELRAEYRWLHTMMDSRIGGKSSSVSGSESLRSEISTASGSGVMISGDELRLGAFSC
jgi:hypothetical protein